MPLLKKLLITLIFNVLYFLNMRSNFDVRYQIKPNCLNIFIAVFGLAFSPLNSATLRCSSVVTLRYLHYYYVYICNNNFDFPSGLQVTMRRSWPLHHIEEGNPFWIGCVRFYPLQKCRKVKNFEGADSKGCAEFALLVWISVNWSAKHWEGASVPPVLASLL